jgi:carboxylesterase
VVTQILPGAEPFSAAGGPAGVLVLHGFTGSPHSLRSLAKAFAAAGFTVELPLLPGHGTSVEDLMTTGWPQWAEAAEQAWADLAGRCDAVFVAGLSMGGSLAIRLAETHPEIAGIVLVNPLVDPPAESFRDLLSGMLAEGAAVVPSIGSDIAMGPGSEHAYDATPIEPMLSMFAGVDDLATGLGELRCPVLLFSSRTDHVVPTESGDLLAARAAGPVERIWLERSFHVATLDYDAAEIEARAVAFLEKLAAAR